jgi:hypothetical protein
MVMLAVHPAAVFDSFLDKIMYFHISINVSCLFRVR